MLKRTIFNAAHREMGAKMVDFGGWDMPLHYGSQIEEHHKVRRDVGMFDVAHMLVVDIEGSGARRFLQKMLANNIDKLQVTGKALYSCMLNDQGGVIDDLIVYFRRPDAFRLVVNAGTAEKDVAWLQKHHIEGVDITPRRDLVIVAVQGPNARARVWQVIAESRAATESLAPFHAAEFNDYFIARTGYTGEEGFEIVLPVGKALGLWQDLNKAGIAPIGLGARDTLRLEAGMNLYGQDMDETISPLEAGLAWTVDLKAPREFIGKAALLSAPINRQLVGLLLLDKGVLRHGQKVLSLSGSGEITSGGFSPTLNRSIALARLPKTVAVGDAVQIEVRDKLLNASVVKYPFVRLGKALINVPNLE